MPYVTSVRQLGDSLTVHFDDGSQKIAYPTGRGIYIVKTLLTDDTAVTNTGEDPTPTPTPSADPTSPDGIYNPWAGQNITGTWAYHISTTGRGGIDYPLAYGTSIKAPASGTLHSANTGGLSDTDTGWVGSAGRRSILVLDTQFPRVNPAEPGEASGDLFAIVFQHQSVMGTNNTHYAEGQVCGKSGASANGEDYGGDVHLHVHGLNASGQRVNLLNFIPPA